MTVSKHNEAQIIATLKQVEAGRTAEEVAREYGVSKHTIYAWKAEYGGMDASEAFLPAAATSLKSAVGDIKGPVLECGSGTVFPFGSFTGTPGASLFFASFEIPWSAFHFRMYWHPTPCAFFPMQSMCPSGSLCESGLFPT